MTSATTRWSRFESSLDSIRPAAAPPSGGIASCSSARWRATACSPPQKRRCSDLPCIRAKGFPGAGFDARQRRATAPWRSRGSARPAAGRSGHPPPSAAPARSPHATPLARGWDARAAPAPQRAEAVSAGICASQWPAYMGVPERVEGALGLAREAGPERVERHTLGQSRAAHTQQARQAQHGTPKPTAKPAEFRGVPWGPPARSRARGLSPRAGRALPAPLPSASPWPRSGSSAQGTGCAALREGGG